MTTPQTEQRELTAGCELDALIAVKVMGWMQVEIGGKRWANIGANHYAGVAPSNLRFVSDWRPSTDIAAAWEVVGKLTDYRWVIERGAVCWTVMLDTRRVFYTATGETAPEAICRAALQAVQS